MKNILTLTVASLFAWNSAIAHTATVTNSLESYMLASLSQIQSQGYKISMANGEKAELEDIYNLNGKELILTGESLKGIEIHMKASVSQQEEIPSLILAAYRPNKERIAMTKVKFNLEGSYAENKIHLTRALSVFTNQIEAKIYAQNSESASDRAPANENKALLAVLGIVAAFVIIPMVLYVHIQMKHSGDNSINAAKINEVIKQTAMKHNIEARAIAKSNIKGMMKKIGSGKRAKVLVLLLTLGLGISEITKN